jgi:hypothetical protein
MKAEMTETVHIRGKLTWKWGRTESGRYIAVCDPISQTVQAEKFRDLLESIDEALDSTLRELLSSGDLESFLQDRGWSTGDLPAKTTRKTVRFDMPFDLKGVRSRDLEEALR